MNPLVYDEDESLSSLIGVVPFGIEDAPPTQTKHAVRGSIPGIGMDDKVVIWGGGIYNWFDPLTLIRAIDRLKERRTDIRLVFMGTKHPNPGVPDMKVAWEAQELARELGLTDQHVFFNSGWVPYNERADFLLDADLGVSTHFEHIETQFSFRTRILDYLWASLPVVATDGDTFAPLIRDKGLGRVVPAGDVDALADALEVLLYDPAAHAAARDQVRVFAEGYRWSRTLAPLVDFCRSPRRAPDLAVERAANDEERPVTVPARISVRKDIALAKEYLQAGGLREVARRASGRARRILGTAG